VINRVNAEVNRVLNAPAMKERIVLIGSVALPLTPAEFGRKGTEDSQRFGKLIRDRGIHGD
jgi:tripartite-type tricarboxylate transporter receptor subunit TctC